MQGREGNQKKEIWGNVFHGWSLIYMCVASQESIMLILLFLDLELVISYLGASKNDIAIFKVC